MVYNVRKEWKKQRVAGLKPFEEFTQQEIKNLLPELRDHYVKIKSIILNEDDMQNPFTVRYRDQDHKLREFCTYAKNGIDARLQALECIEYVASNPLSILDIVREKEHTDSFEW